MDWDALRKAEFPVAENWAYFDHAAVSPLPRRSANVLRAWTDDQERNGVVHWPDWEAKLSVLRKNLARLIHAHHDEIAFVSSTTQGIGLVAEGFPWKSGENVVTSADEYPSNVYPWMNLASRGVGLKLVPTREGRVWVEDLIAAMDSSTRGLDDQPCGIRHGVPQRPGCAGRRLAGIEAWRSSWMRSRGSGR